jgi:hypothetical protein
MRFDSKAFMCVTSADLSASPFGDTLMFCTIGLIIVLILALPLGLLDLENNINLQLAWFVISIGIFLQWVVTAIMFTYTQEYIDNPVQLTAVASKIDSLAGTIMLSMVCYSRPLILGLCVRYPIMDQYQEEGRGY